MSDAYPDNFGLERLSLLKAQYWHRIKVLLKSGTLTLDEAVQGFLPFIAQQLRVRIIHARGSLNHQDHDPTTMDAKTVRGLLHQSGAERVVYVNGRTLESRRYSAAHELVHILRGDAGLQHRVEQTSEYDVERLAAEILMPGRYVEKIFRGYHGGPVAVDVLDLRFQRIYAHANKRVPCDRSPRELAAEAAELAATRDWFGSPALSVRLGVSGKAMARRLLELGLIFVRGATADSPSQSLARATAADVRGPVMMSHSWPSVLTESQHRSFQTAAHDFVEWLGRRFAVDQLQIHPVVFTEPCGGDWLMREGRDHSIEFNTRLLSSCNPEFYELAMIHELFHFYVQRIPNKKDVKELGDDFGGLPMRIFDVEADYYAAQFLKEQRGITLRDYLKLYYDNSAAFADSAVRVPKFERFIGSTLSVIKLFLLHSGKAATDASDLYLPSIASVQTERCLHLIVAPNFHFYVSRASLSERELSIVQSCYARPRDRSLTEYVDTLVHFARHVLNLPESPSSSAA